MTACAASRSSDYEGAAKKFGDLDKQYPYSDWSRKALIMTAYANYEGGSYDDAITASKRYLQLHPGDAGRGLRPVPDGDVLLQPDPGHHPRPGAVREGASLALQELVQTLSDLRIRRRRQAQDPGRRATSSPARKWRSAASICRSATIPAAINRFRDVVAKYQTTRHVEEALERLTEAYMAHGHRQRGADRRRRARAQFPDSPWYKDAYALLQPRAASSRARTPASWISKAFRGVPAGRPEDGAKPHASMLVQLAIRDIVLIDKLELALPMRASASSPARPAPANPSCSTPSRWRSAGAATAASCATARRRAQVTAVFDCPSTIRRAASPQTPRSTPTAT